MKRNIRGRDVKLAKAQVMVQMRARSKIIHQGDKEDTEVFFQGVFFVIFVPWTFSAASKVLP